MKQITKITTVVAAISAFILFQSIIYGIRYRDYSTSDDSSNLKFPLEYGVTIIGCSFLTLFGLLMALGEFRSIGPDHQYDTKHRSWDTAFQRTDFLPAFSIRGRAMKSLLLQSMPDVPK